MVVTSPISNTNTPAVEPETMPAVQTNSSVMDHKDCGCKKRKNEMDGFVKRTKVAQLLHIAAAIIIILVGLKHLNKG